MKNIMLSFLIGTSSLFAVELSQATNQQILSELAHRLKTGTPANAAIANYICDSNYLKATITGETQNGNFSVYIGNSAQCLEQSGVLNAYKSKIAALSILAVCDSNYLRRYKMLPVGTVAEIDSTYIGNYDQCFAQAKSINQN